MNKEVFVKCNECQYNNSCTFNPHIKERITCHSFKEKISITKFKKRAETLLYKLEDLIKTMPDKGDVSNISQKVLLQQAINKVHYAVNGTCEEDLTENTEN